MTYDLKQMIKSLDDNNKELNAIGEKEAPESTSDIALLTDLVESAHGMLSNALSSPMSADDLANAPEEERAEIAEMMKTMNVEMLAAFEQVGYSEKFTKFNNQVLAHFTDTTVRGRVVLITTQMKNNLDATVTEYKRLLSPTPTANISLTKSSEETA